MGGKKSSAPATTPPPTPIPDAKANPDSGTVADQQAAAAAGSEKKPGTTLGSATGVPQAVRPQAERDKATAAAAAMPGGLNASAVLTG